MAILTKFSALINGAQKMTDLSTNTIVVGDITIGGSSGTSLTKTIIDGLISDSHTHSNKSVLDNITAAYTTAEATKVGYISITQSVDLDALESASHTHSNKSTLDNITAAYTTAEATKVGYISVTQSVDLDTMESDIATLQDDLADYIPLTQKGDPNGVATLDSAGKVPVSQLPNSVMEFQGAWNANTNTPTLADGVGNAGDVYRVSVEGTQDLGSGNITFYVGDFVIYSGSVWQRSPMADGVVSVNTQVGAVVLDSDDISDSGKTNKWASAGQLTKVDYLTVTASTDLDTIRSASHTHSNKSVLDDITAAYTTAEATKVGYLTVTASTDLDTMRADSHTHSNKSALDDVSGVNTGDQDASTVPYSPDDQNNWTNPPTYVDGGLDELAARMVAAEDNITNIQTSTVKPMIAGESFAANTTFLVRMALSSETADRVYKATNAAASTDKKYWVIGLVMNAAAKSAGDLMNVVLLGSLTLGSSDTAFGSSDVGLPVWLTTAGGFSVTAPSADDTACMKVGMVQSTSVILVGNMQVTGIN
jgi:hypothetical protein